VRSASACLLGMALLCACTSSPAQSTSKGQEPKFRSPDALECAGDATAAGVLDYQAGHVGDATPEQAAAKEVSAERLSRDGLTQRRSTDATGSVFLDYVDGEGRLVLYLKMQQQPDETWVVGQTNACAPYSGG
jgi:hypothetical protein